MRVESQLKGSGEIVEKVISMVLPENMERCSLLDVGCWIAARTRKIKALSKTFLDIQVPPDPPQPFVQMDAVEFLSSAAGGYDVIFCLDTIEHLVKGRGEELLRLITARASKCALFFTPLGPLYPDPAATHPFAHKSGWWPEEFEARGYSTLVMPRFHDPWEDGKTHGSFFAWRVPIERDWKAALAKMGIS